MPECVALTEFVPMPWIAREIARQLPRSEGKGVMLCEHPESSIHVVVGDGVSDVFLG